METNLTFRLKAANILSSRILQTFMLISFILLTIWIDNIAYFFGLGYLILLLWSKYWDWKIIGLVKPKSWVKLWIQAFGFSLILIILVDILLTPLFDILLGSQPDISALDGIRSNFLNFIIFILFMWLVAAFGEEFIYRGLLIKIVASQLFANTKTAFWISTILSSILFGLAHSYQGLSGIISTGIAGFILCLIYVKNGTNLWLTIITHGVYDTILISFIYLEVDSQVFNLVKNIFISSS